MPPRGVKGQTTPAPISRDKRYSDPLKNTIPIRKHQPMKFGNEKRSAHRPKIARASACHTW